MTTKPKQHRPQALRRLGAVATVAAISAGLVAGAVGAAHAAETPPTGTFADWAWTALWTNSEVVHKEETTAPGGQQEVDYDTHYVLDNISVERAYPEGPLTAQPVNGWTEYNSMCWIEDPAAPTTGPETRVAEQNGQTFASYPDAPQALGELTPENGSDFNWVSPASPYSSIGVVMPTFVSELVVDIASACPSLNLAGPIYIQGADVNTGVFQFSDEAFSQGNHLNWVNGEPDKGAITNAEVTALPTSDGKLKIRFAKSPLKGEAMAGGATVQALTTNGNQVEIAVGYHLLNFGGQPTAADIVRTARVGETVTISETELRASSQYFSNVSPEILVTELPSDVVETTVGGERAFSYTAIEEGAQTQFRFAATEEQAPGGRIQSAPAYTMFRVLSEDAAATPPPATSPPPFLADTGLDYPTDNAVGARGPLSPGATIFAAVLVAVHLLTAAAAITAYALRKRFVARRNAGALK